MEVHLLINDDSKDSIIVNFCLQSKKLNFIFNKQGELPKLQNKKKLFIINQNVSANYLKKFLKKKQFILSKNIILFIPKLFNKYFFNLNLEIINYPISIIDFESYILNFFKSKNVVFLNLILRNDSTLINNDTKKSSHLTEIESKIISFLFQNKFIDKKILNRSVLNQAPSTDSKSLDSHLYRLRKKLNSVDPKRKILLSEKQGIKLV